MTRDTPSRLRIAIYALPAAALSLPTIPVQVQLPMLYGVELGLGLATTGIVLFAARVADVALDPYLGLVCDRLRMFGSRRKLWLAVGAAIAGFGLLRLLNPPAAPGFGYLLANAFALYVGWSIASTAYLAWGAELSESYHARTRITAWRESFGLLGIVGASVALALAVGVGWTEREAIGAMAWGAIAVGLPSIALLLISVGERPADRPAARVAGAAFAELKALRANAPFVRLFGAWVVNGFSNGVPAALFFAYLEFGLAVDPSVRANLVLTYFVAAIVSMPLWVRLSGRFGKHRVWCAAMIVACIVFGAVPFIASGDTIAFGAVCVLTGVALGADLALPPAIQADVVDYGTLRARRSSAGFQFALWGMGTKLAFSAATGAALVGTQILGFEPREPTAQGVQALTALYALLPIPFKLGAISIMWNFPLTAARHESIRRFLARQRARDIGPGGSMQ